MSIWLRAGRRLSNYVTDPTDQRDAIMALGFLLCEQGDDEGARTWFHRAADAGNTSAMALLGILLSDQGDAEGARTWWHRAADAGDANAAAVINALNRAGQ